MKKLASIVLAIGLISQISYAQEYKFTFDSARKTALENSMAIKLQGEIKESISKKNELQKQDYSQNNPDYEYNGITKKEIYNNSYKTYDYKKILKNVSQEEKNMIVSNEKKTMNIFIDIINGKKDLTNKKIELEDANNLVKQAELKLKKGVITQLSLSNTMSNVSKIQTSISSLDKKINLDEKKFKEHLGLNKNDTITLELTEPKFDIILPENAIELSEKSKKEFEDLREDLKELENDMKWIDRMYGENYYTNIDKQEKLIKEKKEDIQQLRKGNLHSYSKSYDEILIKANELELIKINKKQLELQKQKLQALFEKGVITKNEVNKIDMKINENIVQQNKKALEIRWLTFNYDKNIVL